MWYKNITDQICKTSNWFRKIERNLDENPVRLGWVIYEQVGVTIINDYILAGLSFGTKPYPPLMILRT